MLGDHPINVVLLATDLDATKDFYANKIGLKILNESPGALVFKCGGDSQFTVSKSSVGTKDDQTQAAFRVKDLRAEVAPVPTHPSPVVDTRSCLPPTVPG